MPFNASRLPTPSLRLASRAIAIGTLAFGLTLAPTIADAQDVEAGRTHTVKAGDTLWELAQIYLSDPFLWPEIYRLNTDVVEDPHWIFPGEVLQLPGPGAGTMIAGEDPSGGADPSGGPLPEVGEGPVLPAVMSGPTIFASPRGTRGATGTKRMRRTAEPRAEVRQGEYVAAPWAERSGGPRGSGRIVASADISGIAIESQRHRFQFNDRLFVVPPQQRVASVGDRYVSYALGPEISGVGQIVIPTGVLEIVEAHNGEASVARVVEQYDEVRLNQGLIPLDSMRMAPGVRPSAIQLGLQSKIVWIRNDPVVPGIQTYVVIDASLNDGLNPGDQVTVYRPRRRTDRGVVLPEIEIAIAQVVRVTPYGATAMIIDIEQPAVKEGAPVRVTARMP